MRNKKLIPFLVIISSFLLMSSVLTVQATLHNCPSTSPGDTKILEVTTVDETGLEAIFGSNWKTVLNSSFGGNAAKLGAKSKSLIKSMNTSAKYTNPFLSGDIPVCNITVDYWPFMTGGFPEANKTVENVYVWKHPENITTFVNSISSAFLMPSNVTVPWAAAALGQLAVPPAQYLDLIIWEEGWTTPGRKIVHDVTAGYAPPFTTNTYQENCTETWTYFDNGALIGYSLVNNESKTVYEFRIVLPGAEIPGYEFSIFIGVSAITMIGLVYYMKKKR